MSEVEACGTVWCHIPILVLVRVTLLSGDDHCGFIQDSQVNVRIEPVADAAESPAEFFAVASETFFEAPQELRRRYPDLYEQFVQFYRQDPARRMGSP